MKGSLAARALHRLLRVLSRKDVDFLAQSGSMESDYRLRGAPPYDIASQSVVALISPFHLLQACSFNAKARF